MFIEEGLLHLPLERIGVWIAPRIRGIVGNVGQAHGRTPGLLAQCTEGSWPSVGIGAFRQVAADTSVPPCYREALLTKQSPPEVDLRSGHRIVSGHPRRWEPGWQLPTISAAGGQRTVGGRRRGSQ